MNISDFFYLVNPIVVGIAAIDSIVSIENVTIEDLSGKVV